MSLINDALKKAQRQRTGDASPTSQPPMPGGPVAPARPTRANSSSSPQFLLVGAGAVLGLVIAGGAFFLLRSKPAAETAPSTSTPPAVAEAAPVKSADTPPAAPTTPPLTAPSAKSPEPTVVVKTEPASSTAAANSLAAEPLPAAEKNSVVPTAASTVASEPPPPSLRMIESIEALRVAGIRVGTGNDAKVLMNDRVYRIGDTVDHALAIKLTGVTASSLTFRDTTGATYTRNF